MRKLVKRKAEMVTIVDAKRANNISIALSGIRLPYAKIKARLLSASFDQSIMRCRLCQYRAMHLAVEWAGKGQQHELVHVCCMSYTVPAGGLGDDGHGVAERHPAAGPAESHTRGAGVQGPAGLPQGGLNVLNPALVQSASTFVHSQASWAEMTCHVPCLKQFGMFPCQGQHPLHKGVSDPALLGPVERYFIEIMSIARLQERIQCCLVTRTFAENAHMVSALTTAAGKSALFPRAAQCTALQLSASHHAVWQH